MVWHIEEVIPLALSTSPTYWIIEFCRIPFDALTLTTAFEKLLSTESDICSSALKTSLELRTPCSPSRLSSETSTPRPSAMAFAIAGVCSRIELNS
jgi:hypothetical protein